MFDIALAGVEFFHLGRVDVNAQDFEADMGVAQHQGQADIAQAHNADHGLAGVKTQ
jgi:hypothetical protein